MSNTTTPSTLRPGALYVGLVLLGTLAAVLLTITTL
jgi:hypothetical protein